MLNVKLSYERLKVESNDDFEHDLHIKKADVFDEYLIRSIDFYFKSYSIEDINQYNGKEILLSEKHEILAIYENYDAFLNSKYASQL